MCWESSRNKPAQKGSLKDKTMDKKMKSRKKKTELLSRFLSRNFCINCNFYGRPGDRQKEDLKLPHVYPFAHQSFF